MVEARYAVKGETCRRRRRSFYCNTEGEFGYSELWREKRLMETAVFGKKKICKMARKYYRWTKNKCNDPLNPLWKIADVFLREETGQQNNLSTR